MLTVYSSPGKDKDDEIMYGTGSTSTGLKEGGSGAYQGGVPQGDEAPTLHTMPEAEKKDRGVLQQIL